MRDLMGDILDVNLLDAQLTPASLDGADHCPAFFWHSLHVTRALSVVALVKSQVVPHAVWCFSRVRAVGMNRFQL